MQCPQCQTENRAGRKFCAACGQPLALTCPQCGFVNEPDDRFCGGCGRALSPAVPTPAPFQERTPVAYTPKHLADKILTYAQPVSQRPLEDLDRLRQEVESFLDQLKPVA